MYVGAAALDDFLEMELIQTTSNFWFWLEHKKDRIASIKLQNKTFSVIRAQSLYDWWATVQQVYNDK